MIDSFSERSGILVTDLRGDPKRTEAENNGHNSENGVDAPHSRQSSPTITKTADPHVNRFIFLHTLHSKSAFSPQSMSGNGSNWSWELYTISGKLSEILKGVNPTGP